MSLKLICGLEDYAAWSGAKDTWQTICDNNKIDDLESYLEDLYPEGLTMTQLNDILWFDGNQVLKDLDIEIHDTIVVVEDLKKDYFEELKEGFEEDETVGYVIDEIIEKSCYCDEISDSQKDVIIYELDSYFEDLKK